MIITNAHWEERNMGVSCIEISIGAKDCFAEALAAFSASSADYQVIKLSVTRPDLIFKIQKYNFKFVELMTLCKRPAQTPKLLGVQARFVDSTRSALMNESQTQELKKAIDSGMFKTDRVSIDSNFTQSQSANRYWGWLQDELRRGAKLYSLLHNDKSVGFFVLRHLGNGEYRAAIGGIFPEYQSKGYGLSLNYHEIKQAEFLNAQSISVAYSSNNSSVGVINKALGYSEVSSEYVFVRHRNNPSN
jgi:hypothetical protein